MSKVLIIGCGGVASVAIHKCCQVPEVFTEICIASRTKAKCDKLAAELAPTTATKITTAQVDADKTEEVIALIKAYQPDLVMNIALPYQDLTIMDACLACGVNYMDTANYEPENTDDLSGVMFETTDQDAIEEFYPGLGAIKLKQEVCYQHAVTGFCEIMLVEVADSKDVQSVVDIFNQRIDTASDDSFYPETAQLWAQNAQVQTEGNYVAMVALPDGYTVPEKIFS